MDLINHITINHNFYNCHLDYVENNIMLIFNNFTESKKNILTRDEQTRDLNYYIIWRIKSVATSVEIKIGVSQFIKICLLKDACFLKNESINIQFI